MTASRASDCTVEIHELNTWECLAVNNNNNINNKYSLLFQEWKLPVN